MYVKDPELSKAPRKPAGGAETYLDHLLNLLVSGSRCPDV